MEEKEEKTELQNTEKMSYEQLENVAHQLSEQARQLYSKLQEANMTNTFKRLDYLFKVIECSSKFNKEFVNACISEVTSIMTLPEESEENKTEE